MSRIRIVGGTITKTTEGAHHMYSEENIVFNSNKTITEVGKENGIVFGEPKDAPILKMETKDFDITFVLDKNEKTVVPFGILDFENNIENPFFSFKYSLSKSKIDSLSFQIMDDSDTVIYQMTSLKAVIVEASKKTEILFEAKRPTEGPLISKTWDFKYIYDKYTILEPDDYTSEGEYFIHWDGFDNNEMYDSTRFNGKTLKAKIIATKGDKQKSITVDFATEYSQVQWTDVKIDKKAKRIDVTLRVNLKDGGTQGLDCSTYAIDKEESYETFTPTNSQDPYSRVKTTICDWDKIPESDIAKIGKPVIKTRTKSYTDLEKLALDGLKYHWGRNSEHAVAKYVKINEESYMVYIDPINNIENAMDDLDLVYNTNGNWMRSGNPGSATINPISWVGNLISREAICYNVGFVKYSNGWGYAEPSREDLEFKDTSAHEIGHEILKSYGGTVYSYGHKGSVNTVTQNRKDSAPEFPLSGEIDLMPYYKDNALGNEHNQLDYFNRRIAAQNDVLSLIWLTKIKYNE
jgi:hypothetical protein